MDTLSYLIGKKSGSGSSGTIIDSLSVTDNGHYVAPVGHAYNPVSVNIPQPTGNILLTDNGNNINIAQYATATVNVQGGTPVSVQKKDVNFFDYDGTVLYSYTADEFKALNTLPTNPVHTGLTAQGWNWTLSDAKAQVNSIGKCDIGQMYTTSDGKTRLYITIPSNAPSYARTLRLKFSINNNGSVTVDYGDGSSAVTATASYVFLSHDYVDTGDYVITLTVNSGTIMFSSDIFDANNNANGNLRSWLIRVEIGSGVTSIGTNAFYSCYSLQSITIPNGVTDFGSNNAFGNCYLLQSITIPSGVTSIDSNTFSCDYSLQSVMIPSSVTSINSSTFLGCYLLQSITIPSGVTTISSNTFSTCYSLQSVTISSNITSIRTGAFYSCYALCAIHFKSTTPPTVNNSNAWTGLQTSCKIFIPFSASINYLTATNYPSTSTYTYIGYATYADGASLPSQDSSQRCNVKWYPTIMDAVNQTNQITTGNGNKIYCRYV